MKTTSKLAAVAASVALGMTPAVALAAAPGHGHSTEPKHHVNGNTTPKAYGKYCQGESKRHEKGEKGTAFSRCVTDMAKLAKGESKSPADACKNESKRHEKGEKGTAFSRCVAGGERLLKDSAPGGGPRK